MLGTAASQPHRDTIVSSMQAQGPPALVACKLALTPCSSHPHLLCRAGASALRCAAAPAGLVRLRPAAWLRGGRRGAQLWIQGLLLLQLWHLLLLLLLWRLLLGGRCCDHGLLPG